jgi:hypothetical protein
MRVDWKYSRIADAEKDTQNSWQPHRAEVTATRILIPDALHLPKQKGETKT